MKTKISLQASEQDILKYVIKWGEHQLIKRMADRGEKHHFQRLIYKEKKLLG